VRELRHLIREAGGEQLIVSKIEKPEALDDLVNIVRESDAVMVARGDLGVEGAPEDVPFHQKRIIRTCLREGKPVITATQMLQSMIHEPQPTRAEASDVANAVVDGTDAVMLSGETAMGKYPVQATETIARIARRAEEVAAETPHWLQDALLEEMTEQANITYCTDAITLSAVRIAERIGAKAIVCASASGFTARMVTRHRPGIPIICMTPNTRTQKYCAFMWGVTPVIAETRMTTTEHLFEEAAEATAKLGCASAGDQIIVTAGVPLGIGSGHTNLIKVQEVK
jgi:pyruvate kinase